MSQQIHLERIIQRIDRPFIYGFDLDGMSRESRKGALAPMDHKLANVLYRKIKQRSCGRDSTEADIPTRIDEYLSPRMCCIAPSKIGSNESIFCSEPLWYQYKTRLD